MLNWIKKVIYGIQNDSLFLNEVAFQCPCVNKGMEEGCEKCDGTGVQIFAIYSGKSIHMMEEIGYVYIWHRWNPMFKEAQAKKESQ